MSTLSIWTVYDHPTDFPDAFVARRFEVGPQVHATADVLRAADLDTLAPMLSAWFAQAGIPYFILGRSPGDDPKIVQVWM